VDSRRRLLQACSRPAQTPSEAAAAIAEGTAALVDWWKMHRYVFTGEGGEPFQWCFANPTQYDLLRAWCMKNVSDRKLLSELVVKKLVEQGTLAEAIAKDRVRELLGQ
jgi:hypothetical protein